jgi:hypothetical protein
MKYIIMAVALVCASVVFAAQDSALTIRNVRDPVQLRDKLNANALDAQTRVAALEVALTTNQTVVVTGSITAGSLSTTGTVGIAEGQLTDSTVVSADIKNGEIVNADINAAAAIAMTKLETNSLGAVTLTFSSTLCTNVLYFSAQGILTNYTANP